MQQIPHTIAALDIGCGTQDLLVWTRGVEMENCLQMILPSPTVRLARRIRKATQLKKAVHLSGYLMGGGPVCWAIKDHIQAGLKVSAEPDAALTLHDNLEHVRGMGVLIQDEPLDEAVEIEMGDIQWEALKAIFDRFDLEVPKIWCVAVQDHGHCPNGGNRAFRFQHWREFLLEGGEIPSTIYETPPGHLTRMKSVQRQLPGAMVMDTGMAAIVGATCDPWAGGAFNEGVLLVNLGNQHCLAALVAQGRVFGIFEHHTGALDSKALSKWIERFRSWDVDHQEVFQDGGHGCVYAPGGPAPFSFDTIVVTGPKRSMAAGLGWHMAVPFGNMMLTGCYGLVKAYHLHKGLKWP